MIGSSMILGLALGATSGGKIIGIGRRRTLFLCCAVGMIGVGITLIENFWLMIVGRTLLGLACGLQTVVTPRYIEEYIPIQVYTPCFMTYYVSQNLGNLIALFSGLILPPDSDEKALIASNTWYFIYAFPLVWYSIMVALLIGVVRYDSPKYSLVKGKKEDCIAVIHQIYKTGGNDELANEITEFIGSTIQKQSISVTYKEAFCSDERYTRASWINVVYIVFHELTGINIILTYSNTILENIIGDKTSGFNARTGTYMVSLANFFSSVLGIWIVKAVGRRTLLLWGHAGIFVAHLLVGIFTVTEVNVGVIVMICFFLFAY